MAHKICQECYWHKSLSAKSLAKNNGCCCRFPPTTICNFEDGEPLDFTYPEVNGSGGQCVFADRP